MIQYPRLPFLRAYSNFVVVDLSSHACCTGKVKECWKASSTAWFQAAEREQQAKNRDYQ
jgi:hypothetical protein